MDETTKHILDIKERLATIEAVSHEIRYDLKEHSRASLEMRREVDLVKSDVAEAKTVLNVLRWVVVFTFMTAPAVAAAFLKLYTYLGQ